MPSATSNHVPSEIIRYIEVSSESDNIDAKGPMSWDGDMASASLAKDLVSFANSRDGGVIVVGKAEVNPGVSGDFDWRDMGIMGKLIMSSF